MCLKRQSVTRLSVINQYIFVWGLATDYLLRISIVRIYAPCKGEELSRILISKGTLITVTPAAEHLQELKALIYDEVKLHPVKEENLPNFVLLDETRLNYKMSLAGSEAYELLAMTPFAWRASEEVKQGLLLSDVKNYTADFLIRVYQYQGE